MSEYVYTKIVPNTKDLVSIIEANIYAVSFCTWTPPDILKIYFDVALSAGDESVLDNIVAAYNYIANDPDFFDLILTTSSSLAQYKEITYTGDFITKVELYADVTKMILQYTLDYAYIGDLLSTITVTRASDSLSYVKTVGYDNDNNLISVDRTII